MDRIRNNMSVVSLIVFNLVPLFGVLFYGWEPFNVLFLYWLESGVIGFYTILKIVKVMNVLSILVVPFFIIHFGGFMWGHLFFLAGLLGDGFNFSVSQVIKTNLPTVWPAIAMLFVSHGISFIQNFIGKKEYLNYASGASDRVRGGRNVMLGPYNRIILMHVAIIFGGWLTILLGSPTWILILLIFIKIGVDLKVHKKEHSFDFLEPQTTVVPQP